MRFSRARYVTLCQQSLVTAAVLVVGLSAAGIKTLDIVPAPEPLTQANGALPPAAAPQLLAGHNGAPEPAKSEVDATPVTPKVREVKVASRVATPASTPQARVAPTTPARVLVDHKPLVALSTPQKVTGYGTVGVTWKHGVSYSESAIAVQVRTEKAGRWSSWSTLQYHDDHGPDGDPGELTAHSRPGTDPYVVGNVDLVQIRAETVNGAPIPDLQLAVIDPGTGKMVEQHPAIDTAKLAGSSNGATSATAPAPAGSASDTASDTASLSAMKIAPKPYIYSRAQWGANEHLREQGLPNYGTIKTGFIHHTVNANNYSAAQVPALLRGIYAYHVESRGWRDIGYNFLVDRFGRIWEGRYGGVNKAVVGAHTLGYNEVSFAMSAIGNYDITQPPQAVLDAYARLFAWKLSMYNIRAEATHIWVKNRYLNAINGHRDVGQTACPGKYLYAKIPEIRAMAQKIQDAAQSGTPVSTPKPTPKPDPNAMTSPTQAPLAAVAQPAIKLPRSLNLAGSSSPDLVLSRGNGTVSVLPTGGQLGYRSPVTSSGNWRSYSMVVAVGDVTGDGRGDVFVRNRSGVSGIVAGNGSGRTTGPVIGLTPRFRYADAVVGAGDWNRDGKNDLIVRTAHSGNLWLVPGLGGGRFGRAIALSKSFGAFTRIAVVGDVTGDGRPDILALHRNGYLYLAPGTSSGGIGPLMRRSKLGTSYTMLAGGAHDFNGDRLGDLVVRNTKGNVYVLPGRGWGWFGRAYGPFPAVPALSSLSAGQMTGNAAPDLVGVDSTGKLQVLAYNALTNLLPSVTTNLHRSDIMQVLNVGDWNGDGRGDIITRLGGGSSLALWPGRGNGTFGSGISMGYGWKSFTRLAAVGDVTGDGHPDLIGRSASGVTVIFPGNGRSGFLRPVKAANYIKTFNQIGTGYWKPQQFATATYLGANDGFVPFRGTGVGSIPGYNWVIGPGDVDGDGKPDLVARDSSGTLWLLPGTDSGYATRRLIGEGFSSYTLGG